MDKVLQKIHNIEINGILILAKRIHTTHGFITYRMEVINDASSFYMYSNNGDSFAFVQRNILCEDIKNIEGLLSHKLSLIHNEVLK